MAIERRHFEGTELREVDGQPAVIRGLAAPYYDGTPSTEYELWPGAVERYMPGAFDSSLGDDIRVLFNHDSSAILGRTKANTAKVYATARGIEYMAELADTTVGRDVRTHAKRGDISGSSVGMFVKRDTWSKENGKEVRSINEAGLLEVSAVTFPAYTGTEVHARDIEHAKQEWQEMQRQNEDNKKQLQEVIAAEIELLKDM